MENVIEARGISRSISGAQIIDRVQFEIIKGQCLGIAGAAGSGKTTLLRMLAGLIPPSDGELFILQLNAKINSQGVRAKVGLVPERDGFEQEQSALDALLVHGALYGLPYSRLKSTARELLRRVQLDEVENWPIYALKRGQIRRLSLARALIHSPEILFVDGPIRDLLPAERRILWDLLQEQKKRGMTMVIASRDLDELEKLCDRVMILNHGAIACQGSPETLIEQHIGKKVVEYQVSTQDIEYHLQALGGKFQYQLLGDKLKIFLRESIEVQTAFRWVPSERILYRRAYLKDVYVKLMGHDLAGGPL